LPVARLSSRVNGTLLATYQYDPYGNLLSSTGSVANPWRFAGGYFESSTGLYKYGTRYYNPGFGRWSQQDPLRGQLNDPTSLNRYLSVSDDPGTLVDPSGLSGWIWQQLSILPVLGFCSKPPEAGPGARSAGPSTSVARQ